MLMLIMVLDDPAHLNEVLRVWKEAGVGGVTIVESTGINRVMQRSQADPAFSGFGQIFGGGRVGHNTLFAVVDDLAVAEAAVAATETVVGSLHDPHTGIVIALPVAAAWGVGPDGVGSAEQA